MPIGTSVMLRTHAFASRSSDASHSMLAERIDAAPCALKSNEVVSDDLESGYTDRCMLMRAQMTKKAGCEGTNHDLSDTQSI